MPSDAAREISRLTNQNIRDFAFGENVRPGWTWQFFCECGCFTLVAMTLAEYDARAWARRLHDVYQSALDSWSNTTNASTARSGGRQTARS